MHVCGAWFCLFLHIVFFVGSSCVPSPCIQRAAALLVAVVVNSSANLPLAFTPAAHVSLAFSLSLSQAAFTELPPLTYRLCLRCSLSVPSCPLVHMQGSSSKANRRALLEESKQRRTSESKPRQGIFETLRQVFNKEKKFMNYEKSCFVWFGCTGRVTSPVQNLSFLLEACCFLLCRAANCILMKV